MSKKLFYVHKNTMITTKTLTYTLRQKTILKHIDVCIRPGELMIIIGPNGAGKSTLLNIMAREIEDYHGKIFFKEKSLEEWENRKLVQHKAKFSQEYNADIGLSVQEIVLMGRYPYFQANPTAEDLTHVATAMQETDIYTLRTRRYNSLSGGEKQRVHLARVLAQLKNPILPKLAFFDEPLNNLDVKYQHKILGTLRSFVKQGNSAVIVLHDLNLTSEFADRVLLIKQGKILAQGKPDEIFIKPLIQKAYDFPCTVCPNPITRCPMIIFGSQNTPYPPH